MDDQKIGVHLLAKRLHPDLNVPAQRGHIRLEAISQRTHLRPEIANILPLYDDANETRYCWRKRSQRGNRNCGSRIHRCASMESTISDVEQPTS